MSIQRAGIVPECGEQIANEILRGYLERVAALHDFVFEEMMGKRPVEPRAALDDPDIIEATATVIEDV